MVGCQHFVMCRSTVCNDCRAVFWPELPSAQPCIKLCNQRTLKECFCVGICKCSGRCNAFCRFSTGEEGYRADGPANPPHNNWYASLTCKPNAYCHVCRTITVHNGTLALLRQGTVFS